jgi:superfamily I DNA and RNA helicase
MLLLIYYRKSYTPRGLFFVLRLWCLRIDITLLTRHAIMVIKIGEVNNMPAVIDKTGRVSLNDHIAEYIKSDQEFLEGIRKGVRACKEDRVKRWADIKKELGLR